MCLAFPESLRSDFFAYLERQAELQRDIERRALDQARRRRAAQNEFARRQRWGLAVVRRVVGLETREAFERGWDEWAASVVNGPIPHYVNRPVAWTRPVAARVKVPA